MSVTPDKAFKPDDKAGSTDTPVSSHPGELLQPGCVLVVDDSELVRDSIAAVLEKASFDVVTAADGAEARALVDFHELDVVVSDICMPGMDGLELLQSVKDVDRDLPVVLLTGMPDLRTAIKAVELGAFHYLTKPFHAVELQEVVGRAFRMSRLSRIRRQAARLAGIEDDPGRRASMSSRLDLALERITMSFQPLVDVERREVFGYEALLRTSLTEVRRPSDVLELAEKLDRLHDLGRAVRSAVVDVMAATPPNRPVFINLHPLELTDPDLLDPTTRLARRAADIVLEITERAALERVDGLADRIRRLREIGYRIAVDDLGAGYASLNSFAQLQPDFVKLDMALVQQAPADPVRRRLIRSMIQVCHEMDITVVGEGVETIEQRETLHRLGCTRMQGFLFSHPGQPFPAVVF